MVFLIQIKLPKNNIGSFISLSRYSKYQNKHQTKEELKNNFYKGIHDGLCNENNKIINSTKYPYFNNTISLFHNYNINYKKNNYHWQLKINQTI